jgi:hypothetical protein
LLAEWGRCWTTRPGKNLMGRKHTNLEGLKKKYSWWLAAHEDKKPTTSPEKADLDDTVTLFKGKNTLV